MTASNDNITRVNWHESQKCPVGSMGLVSGIGICEVAAAKGWQRQITWTPDPDDITRWESRWINVREIQRLIPKEPKHP